MCSGALAPGPDEASNLVHIRLLPEEAAPLQALTLRPATVVERPEAVLGYPARKRTLHAFRAAAAARGRPQHHVELDQRPGCLSSHNFFGSDSVARGTTPRAIPGAVTSRRVDNDECLGARTPRIGVANRLPCGRCVRSEDAPLDRQPSRRRSSRRMPYPTGLKDLPSRARPVSGNHV